MQRARRFPFAVGRCGRCPAAAWECQAQRKAGVDRAWGDLGRAPRARRSAGREFKGKAPPPLGRSQRHHHPGCTDISSLSSSHSFSDTHRRLYGYSKNTFCSGGVRERCPGCLEDKLKWSLHRGSQGRSAGRRGVRVDEVEGSAVVESSVLQQKRRYRCSRLVLRAEMEETACVSQVVLVTGLSL